LFFKITNVLNFSISSTQKLISKWLKEKRRMSLKKVPKLYVREGRYGDFDFTIRMGKGLIPIAWIRVGRHEVGYNPIPEVKVFIERGEDLNPRVDLSPLEKAAAELGFLIEDKEGLEKEIIKTFGLLKFEMFGIFAERDP
jgi:hypothetical protein